MKALPHAMDAADVAREHESSAAQYYAHRLEQLAAPAADAAPRTPFFQLVEQMRNSDRCALCHKTRVLIQMSTPDIRVREERPDPRVHCACPGGPAYAGIGSVIPAPTTTPSPFTIGTLVRAHVKILHIWERGAPMEWIEAGTDGVVADLQGHIASIAFVGHVQPYQHFVETLGNIVTILDRGPR